MILTLAGVWFTLIILLSLVNPQRSILKRLAAVFEKLQQAKPKLRFSICNFFKTEISFLGHIVSREGIATDQSKVETV